MANSIARPTANRAVHLRITPRPSDLGESREVMRLLSQFGEIEYFKNMKYDILSAPTAALIVYKEEGAAQACLKRSPIRFRMGRAPALLRETVEEMRAAQELREENVPETANNGGGGERKLPRGPLGTPFGLPSQTRSISTQQLPKPSRNAVRMPFDPPPASAPSPIPSPGSESRIFQIQTNPSFRAFRDQINWAHCHGAFAIDSKTFGQGDMAKKVPVLGLSCMDWRADQRPWRKVREERERETEGPMARRRLGEVWEEGERERKAGDGTE